jgi:lysophospholipase L1-like esterase
MLRLRYWLGNALLIVASVALTLASVELLLRAERAWNPAAATPQVAPPAPVGESDDLPSELAVRTRDRWALFARPLEWREVRVDEPGATLAFRWHGALHVSDANGMRRTTPFPDRRSDTYRVMVVGDSLTYGYGLPEQDTFVALLNQWLGRDYRVEFLNLGVPGHNSEDIAQVVKSFLPQLRPNLVLYAMCFNDFLPSRSRQLPEIRHGLSLPRRLERMLTENSLLGAFVSERYDAALRRLRLRVDFYDHILEDFHGYQQRFARDVHAMNDFVRETGLPPPVALALDQYPEHGGRGYLIAQAAEGHLRSAGFEVIPTEDYFRRYHGQMMGISPWEGHPDERANFIWATMIARVLRGRDDLQPFRQ